MFSVVIPLYNKELSVRNTINSVLDQTFKEFEIVIVNDGSTDNSLEIVQQFKDDRIRIIDKPNGGVSSARNRGIKEAKYDWIAFLDGDDLWKENHLSTFANMIMTYPNDKVFCTSHTKSKYKNGYLPIAKGEYEVIDNYFKTVIQHVDFFWTGAVCIHKSVFEKVGNFPLGINRGEDLYLWAKIGKQYRIIRSTKETVTYKVDAENKLTNSHAKYGNSIVSILNLKINDEHERRYYKHIVVSRLKRHIKQKDFIGVCKILLRYNIQLVF